MLAYRYHTWIPQMVVSLVVSPHLDLLQRQDIALLHVFRQIHQDHTDLREIEMALLSRMICLVTSFNVHTYPFCIWTNYVYMDKDTNI